MTSPALLQDAIDRDDQTYVDGVHHLRPRTNSRLWYRSAGEEAVAVDAGSADAASEDQSLPNFPADWVEMLNRAGTAAVAVDGREALLARQLADIARFALAPKPPIAELHAVGTVNSTDQPKRSTLERVTAAIRAEDEAAARAADEPAAAPVAASGVDTVWSVAPASAPMLLLSATPLLVGRRPGPIVGPGSTFRIVDVQDGVVALEVRCDDGLVVAGFGNAVDVRCIDPSLGRGRGTGKLRVAPQTARLRWQRITGSLRGSGAG